MLLRPFLSCLAFLDLALASHGSLEPPRGTLKRQATSFWSHQRNASLWVKQHRPRHGISPNDTNEVETSFRGTLKRQAASDRSHQRNASLQASGHIRLTEQHHHQPRHGIPPNDTNEVKTSFRGTLKREATSDRSHRRNASLQASSHIRLMEQHQTRHGISPSDANEVETFFRVASGNFEIALDVKQPLLFLAVMTARSNTKRRADVRSSWWQHFSLKVGFAKASFFIGEPDPDDMSAQVVSKALAEEKHKYKDIVDLPIKDTYDNLSRKTNALFDWFAREKPARFLAKIDDDTFPHIDMLLPRLSTLKSESVYMGLLFESNPVRRVGQWAEKVYRGDVFPSYMNGPGYILDSSLVSKIVEMQDRVFITNEDANVGLWVRQVTRLGISVHYIPVDATFSGCDAQDVFSQNLEIGEMPCMWQNNRCCARTAQIWLRWLAVGSFASLIAGTFATLSSWGFCDFRGKLKSVS